MAYLFTARTLIAGTLMAALGIWGAIIATSPKHSAAVTLNPVAATTVVGESFTVDVVVRSDVPANAYSGLITFDYSVLRVDSISYNTSIADLWVSEPWYENGDGTISFAGGTTKVGAFTGKDVLLTISFIPIAVGEGSVDIAEATVLAHNGFGSELQLAPAIDALFSDESLSTEANPLGGGVGTMQVTTLPTPPQYDINNDGVIDIRDMSIFMPKLFTNEAAYDFNRDGRVTLVDFSMLLDARR